MKLDETPEFTEQVEVQEDVDEDEQMQNEAIANNSCAPRV